MMSILCISVLGSSSNDGISVGIVIGSVQVSCVLVGISIIATIIVIGVILKTRLWPNKKR